MKIEVFDVVELKNKNKATILNKTESNEYLSEIIDKSSTKVEKRIITESDIERVIYSR